MFLLTLITAFFIFRAEAGELLIYKSPPSIKFYEGDSMNENTVSEVLSAAVGFTTQGVSKWNGMEIASPFGFAKGITVLDIEGGDVDLGEFDGCQKYIVHNNENNLNIWKSLRNKIINRYPVENNTILKYELSCPEEVPMNYFDKNLDDFICLKETNELKRKLNKVRNMDGVPDLYWFSIKSSYLNALYPFGIKEKVYELLSKLDEIYTAAYQNQVLIVALVGDATHRRRIRSLSGENMEKIVDNIQDYICDPDFPVIFNIILWFTLGFFFSLFAVSVFIASMDPGRDSIIYRMTSNRMKKDS